MNRDYCLVLCTCPNREVAEQIAQHLVSEHLAACVNILSGMTSVYLWKGRIETDPEHLILIKTDPAHYPEVERCILDQHPYELPEIIAVPVEQGHEEYLNWIHQCLNPKP